MSLQKFLKNKKIIKFESEKEALYFFNEFFKNKPSLEDVLMLSTYCNTEEVFSMTSEYFETVGNYLQNLEYQDKDENSILYIIENFVEISLKFEPKSFTNFGDDKFATMVTSKVDYFYDKNPSVFSKWYSLKVITRK
jgi:hypothetical protein